MINAHVDIVSALEEGELVEKLKTIPEFKRVLDRCGHFSYIAEFEVSNIERLCEIVFREIGIVTSIDNCETCARPFLY